MFAMKMKVLEEEEMKFSKGRHAVRTCYSSMVLKA